VPAGDDVVGVCVLEGGDTVGVGASKPAGGDAVGVDVLEGGDTAGVDGPDAAGVASPKDSATAVSVCSCAAGSGVGSDLSFARAQPASRQLRAALAVLRR
jgi:hypothetical protein